MRLIETRTKRLINIGFAESDSNRRGLIKACFFMPGSIVRHNRVAALAVSSCVSPTDRHVDQ